MNGSEMVDWIRRELLARADPAFRQGVKRFFHEPVKAYGVRTPVMRAIARLAGAETKRWTTEERRRLAETLWSSGILEESSVAIELFRRAAKQGGEAEFRLFEHWIEQYVGNWGASDGVSCYLLAPAIRNDPGLIRHLAEWTASRNRWKRRAAIVSLVREAKQGRHTEAILEIASRLITDTDDMVQKGIGWVLKETYPAKPRQVTRFLIEQRGNTARLVLRLAAEKMTVRDRERVLTRRTSSAPSASSLPRAQR